MTTASRPPVREAVRAIYAAFDPMHGSIGRDDSAGDTQPQLRPPTDLRGIPAALVSLTSHGAGGNGTALPKAAAAGPRGSWSLRRGT